MSTTSRSVASVSATCARTERRVTEGVSSRGIRNPSRQHEPCTRDKKVAVTVGGSKPATRSSVQQAIVPEVAVHSLELIVEEADIDELGHASNIAYVRWIQAAAIAHSAAVGLD